MLTASVWAASVQGAGDILLNGSQSSRAGETDMKEIIILQKCKVLSLMDGRRLCSAVPHAPEHQNFLGRKGAMAEWRSSGDLGICLFSFSLASAKALAVYVC